MFGVTPDWSTQLNAEGISKEFADLKWAGPGFYLRDSDTLLAVPNVDPSTCSQNDMWAQPWPKDTLFRVYVWNVPYKLTICNFTVGIPCRQGFEHR